MDALNRSQTTLSRLPTFYVPHGGGPCFFIDWPAPDANMWEPLASFLRGLQSTLEVRPRAIVVVSGHWEQAVPTVTSARKPALIFDYSGFPPHTYELTYTAPGSPAVAARTRELLAAAGIAAASDPQRGFDHGVFIPFMLIEPQATLPIVALSLVAGLDAAAHLAIGKALMPLRDEGVLIVGSGMSYHNMSGFRAADAPGSTEFDAWLSAAATAEPNVRTNRLQAWQAAPNARLAHPREEHLLPLMVAAGAGGSDAGRQVFGGRIMGAQISGYRFG